MKRPALFATLLALAIPDLHPDLDAVLKAAVKQGVQDDTPELMETLIAELKQAK
jgi:hypothetical protein